MALNPFGTNAGGQWKYPLATTGLGRLDAIVAADKLDPNAPEHTGRLLVFATHPELA